MNLTRRRLAIADPPYLGRANRWYGDGRGSGRRQVSGRIVRKPDYHPEAAAWDVPERHAQLVRDLAADYDGWAIAAHSTSLYTYLEACERAGIDYRVGVWARPNAVPGGARVVGAWEPVIFHIPAGRRAHATGLSARDYLVAPVRPRGFVGSKPPEWTRWALTVLGHQADDEVVDMFPGSGAVAAEIHQAVII